MLRFGRKALKIVAAIWLLALLGPVQVTSPILAAPTPSGPVEIDLRIQTPDYRMDAQGVRVPGYGVNDAPGAPALPVWSTLVELPSTGEWTMSVAPGEGRVLRRDLPLTAVPVPQSILPDPTGWADADWPDAVPTVDRPDPAIFQRGAFYPDAIVQTGAVQWQRGRRLLPVRVFPFEYNPVAGLLRYHPDVRVMVRVQPMPETGSQEKDRSAVAATPPLQTGSSAPQPSALNPAARLMDGGGALRVSSGARGMYRLTYDDLVAAGVPVTTTDPATFAMSYLGQPIDIQVTARNQAGAFGPGDLVVFYGEPYQGRYLNHNVYWFTYGGGAGARIATRTVTPTGSEPLVTEITRTLHVEYDRNYISTLHRPQDADHWFDSVLGSVYPPISYTLSLTDPLTSGSVVLRALVNSGPAQTVDPNRSVSLRLNDHAAGAYAWTGLVDHLITTTVAVGWLDASPNKLGLWPGTGLVYPDWIEVAYPALARAHGDSLYIEGVAPGANKIEVTGFSTAGAMVYDVRDGDHPVRIVTPTVRFDGSSYTLDFWDEDLPNPTYFLTTEAALAAPLAIEADTPSTWGTPDHDADYIAIVHRSLWDVIQPLLDHRASAAGGGFRVAKVDVQDIYDEFSYGRRDPEAIRAFLSYAYHYWNDGGAPPAYVLLVGDGHYDFTGVSGTALLNLIPPYLIDIDPWVGETAADNRFVSVDPPDDPSDFLPDMAIGRIPAQTPADVTAVVNKILAYETSATAGDWQRRAVYVADNCADPAGDFHALSDQSRLGRLPPQYDDRTIYFGDQASCPEASYNTIGGMYAGISGAFNNGALMLQWFGHASIFRLGYSGTMFANKDVISLNTNSVWPVSFSYSCWTGYFINLFVPTYYNNLAQSLGETLVLTPDRGSVADLSPSGKHVGGVLVILNQGMTQAIFQDRIDRIGDAVNAGKLYYYAHQSSFLDVIDTSNLFGDPALRLRLPPIIALAQDHTLAALSWKHVPQYTSYEVWRSTQPYFNPGDPGSEMRGTVLAPTTGEDVIFKDGDAIGNVDHNYVYVVRGVNAAGTTGASNRLGEFDFAVTPGN